MGRCCALIAIALLLGLANPALAQQPPQGMPMRVLGYAVHVRALPTKDSKVLATLRCGDEVFAVARTTNGWIKISTPVEGFVHGRLLANEDRCHTPDPPYVVGETIARVRLRDFPDVQSGNVIFVLDKAQPITVTAFVNRDWLQVYYQGSVFFVHRNFVRLPE